VTASRRGRVAVTLFIALALVLGYAAWRGWLPGVADYDRPDLPAHMR
jgi:hypothetical protein